MHEIRSLACKVAAIGLPAGNETGPPLEVPPEMWRGLLGQLTTQRLTGIAVGGIRAGRLRLGLDEQASLFDAHRSAMVAVLVLQRKMLEAAAAFDVSGLEVVVLKGSALANAFYPNPSWRAFGDIDLLVRASRWAQACSILSGLGYRRIVPEPRPGFDQRFGKGATFADAHGSQADLHRTLALGPFGLWIDADRLFDHVAEFEIGGRTLRRLDDTASLLHVCLHAVLGRKDPLLMPLRDVLQVAWSDRVDWDELHRLASAWRLTGPMGRALRTAASTLQTDLPEGARSIASALGGSLERRLLRSYTTDRREAGGLAVASLWAIRGVEAKAAYVRALAFPSREFLIARAGEEASYRSRLMVPIAWLRARSRRFGLGRRG